MSTPGAAWSVGDRELEQLAAEPVRPLFPLLTHADAMIALVVVLAFVPALYAVANRTLTESGAWLALASLKCLAPSDSTELLEASSQDGPANPAVDRTSSPDLPFRFQPPFMLWLTALGMKAFGGGTAAGLVAAAYFCTASLILSAYAFAKRLGGERLGLLTVLVLGFNPHILRGAQEPVPQSAAVCFALLSLAGLLAHWQKSTSLASYMLLLAGVALGMCLVAGGPVALAVVLIALVYVVWWKFEAWHQGRSGIIWDRSQFSRRTALRSTLILAATGFALAGWTVLLPGARHGAVYYSEWLAGPGIVATAADHVPSGPRGLRAFWELQRLTVPLFGLSLLGLAAIVRDLWRADEDPARRHRGILLAWILVALLVWMFLGRTASQTSPIIQVWETLLAVPLMITAALGLSAIAERRIGFLLSLSIGILTIADAAFVARGPLDGARPENQFTNHVHAGAPFVSLLIPLALVAAGIALAVIAGTSEKRRRLVLSGVLVAILLANCLWGATVVRRTDTADRELESLHAGLSRLSHVDRLTFVANSSSKAVRSSQPPAQLIFGLASLWPQAAMNFAESWETAANNSAGPNAATTEPGIEVFISWSPRGRLSRAAPDPTVKTAAAPFSFHGLEVAAYVRDR
jgi:4-amino-4-deoxy-L-arabinose transferase-like glycosyltransferase